LNLRTDVAQVGVSMLGKDVEDLALSGKTAERSVGEILADQRKSFRRLAFLRKTAVHLQRITG
jgi:hypothetical protein